MPNMPQNERTQGLSDPRHSRRASPALQALTELDPALAALGLWCQHRDDDAVDRVTTEGHVIHYGPGFETLPRHVQIGLAGHHILHVALQHPARMAAMQLRLGDAFDAEIWQIACDAIVNETILAAEHALPRPCLTLAALLDGSGPALLATWDAERLYFRLSSGDGARDGRLKSAARAQGFQPDLRPGDETDATGGELDAGDWRGHLARALAAGRAAGVGLGAMGHHLADLPRPTIPWEQLLRRWLSATTLPRPAPASLVPARRWLAMAGYAQTVQRPLPPWQANLTSPQPQPRLLVALDASGSIERRLLTRFLAEAANVARRMRMTCRLVVFDTDLRQELTLDPANVQKTLAQLDLPEGGGTDFRPVFAFASDYRPSGLIILTDLDGPMPRSAPRFPVLWACPEALDPSVTPAFGRCISLAR